MSFFKVCGRDKAVSVQIYANLGKTYQFWEIELETIAHSTTKRVWTNTQAYIIVSGSWLSDPDCSSKAASERLWSVCSKQSFVSFCVDFVCNRNWE